jgi:hypothetical protein
MNKYESLNSRHSKIIHALVFGLWAYAGNQTALVAQTKPSGISRVIFETKMTDFDGGTKEIKVISEDPEIESFSISKDRQGFTTVHLGPRVAYKIGVVLTRPLVLEYAVDIQASTCAPRALRPIKCRLFAPTRFADLEVRWSMHPNRALVGTPVQVQSNSQNDKLDEVFVENTQPFNFARPGRWSEVQEAELKCENWTWLPKIDRSSRISWSTDGATGNNETGTNVIKTVSSFHDLTARFLSLRTSLVLRKDPESVKTQDLFDLNGFLLDEKQNTSIAVISEAGTCVASAKQSVSKIDRLTPAEIRTDEGEGLFSRRSNFVPLEPLLISEFQRQLYGTQNPLGIWDRNLRRMNLSRDYIQARKVGLFKIALLDSPVTGDKGVHEIRIYKSFKVIPTGLSYK